MVIDGQQRLTTLSLLLVALANADRGVHGSLPMDRDEILDDYLTNRHGRGEDRSTIS
jgi:uncharacterized protein with ParB-like and HNH nuclease domain